MDKPLVTFNYRTTNGKRICIEVSIEVKELLQQSDRQIRSQRRQDRRYRDNVEFIDGLSDALMKYPPPTDPADLLIRKERNEWLNAALNTLCDVQRRRLILHFYYNLSRRQIAKLDGVSQAAIGHSIKIALRNLRKLLSE